MQIQIQDMTTDYIDLIAAIVSEGEITSPRGELTHELSNVHLHLENPTLAMPVGLGRRASMRILAAETIQWMAGFSDLKQLNSVSRGQFGNYSDDGIKLYGAYGPRTVIGLDRAVRKLSEDPSSRQAVASIWREIESPMTKDLPCTTSWGFRIRDNKLHMTTTMRSNDAWTGITYDIPAMTRIQSAVAWALGVDVGAYDHFVMSLHLYDRDAEKVLALTPGGDQVAQPPMLTKIFGDGILPPGIERWRRLRDDILPRVYRGEVDGLAPELAWFARKLKDTDRYPYFCPKCRYWLPQPELLCPA